MLKKSLTLLLYSALFSLTSFAQEPGKADLQLVTENLDMDGQFFMANNIEGDLPKLAKLANDWLKQARTNGNEKYPKTLDTEKMLAAMGLDQIVAYGRSAKHEGDHWVSKMFMQTNGSNKGALSLIGEKAEAFDIIAFAPAGTDLAMEMQMDMRQADDLIMLLEDMPKCKKSQKMLDGLKRKMPSGITGAELMDKLNMKMSIAVKLDDEKRVVCPIYPEYTFPEMHTCIRLKGAMVMWNQIAPMAGFMMNLEKQEDGTTLLTPKRMPNKGFMKDKKPVMLVDQANDLLWMASSKEFLTACLTDGEKLNTDTTFNAISGGIKEGNMLAYLSRQTCLELRQVKEAKYKKADKKKLSADMKKKILDHVTESQHGYIMTAVKSDAGIHINLKAPCPLKEMICGGKGCFKGKSCGKKKGCSTSKCDKKQCDEKGCGCDNDKCICENKSADGKCGGCEPCKEPSKPQKNEANDINEASESSE